MSAKNRPSTPGGRQSTPQLRRTVSVPTYPASGSTAQVPTVPGLALSGIAATENVSQESTHVTTPARPIVPTAASSGRPVSANRRTIRYSETTPPERIQNTSSSGGEQQFSPGRVLSSSFSPRETERIPPVPVSHAAIKLGNVELKRVNPYSSYNAVKDGAQDQRPSSVGPRQIVDQEALFEEERRKQQLIMRQIRAEEEKKRLARSLVTTTEGRNDPNLRPSKNPTSARRSTSEYDTAVGNSDEGSSSGQRTSSPEQQEREAAKARAMTGWNNVINALVRSEGWKSLARGDREKNITSALLEDRRALVKNRNELVAELETATNEQIRLRAETEKALKEKELLRNHLLEDRKIAEQNALKQKELAQVAQERADQLSAELEAAKKLLQSQSAESQSQFSSREAEVRQLQFLSKQLEAQEEEAAKLKQQAINAVQEVVTVRKQEEKNQQAIADLKLRETRLSEQLNQLAEQKRQESDRLKEQLTQLAEERQRESEELESLRARARAADERKEKKQEAAAANDAAKAAEKQKRRAAMEKLTSEAEQARQSVLEMQQLREQLTQLAEERQRESEELESLRARARAADERKEKKQEAAAATTAVKAAEKRERGAAMEKLTSEAEQARQSVLEMQQRLAEATKQADHLRSIAASAEARVHEAEQEADRKVRQHVNELEDARRQLAERSTDLNRVQSSKNAEVQVDELANDRTKEAESIELKAIASEAEKKANVLAQELESLRNSERIAQEALSAQIEKERLLESKAAIELQRVLEDSSRRQQDAEGALVSKAMEVERLQSDLRVVNERLVDQQRSRQVSNEESVINAQARIELERQLQLQTVELRKLKDKAELSEATHNQAKQELEEIRIRESELRDQLRQQREQSAMDLNAQKDAALKEKLTLQGQYAEARRELDEQKGAYKIQQQEIERVRAATNEKIASLEQQISQRQATEVSTQADTSQLSSQIALLRAELQTKEDVNKSSARDLALTSERAQDLSRRVEEASRLELKLQDDLDLVGNQYREAQNRYHAGIAEAQEQARKAESEARAAVAEVQKDRDEKLFKVEALLRKKEGEFQEKLDGEVVQIQAQLRQAEERYRLQLATEISRVQEASTTALGEEKERLAQQNQRVLDATTEIELLKHQLRVAQQTSQSFEQEARTAREKANALIQKEQTANDEVIKAQTVARQHLSELDQARRGEAKAIRQLEQQSAELARLKQAQQTLESSVQLERGNDRSQFDNLSREIEQRTDAIRALESMVSFAKAETDHIRFQLDAVNKRAESLEGLHKLAQDQVLSARNEAHERLMAQQKEYAARLEDAQRKMHDEQRRHTEEIAVVRTREDKAISQAIVFRSDAERERAEKEAANRRAEDAEEKIRQMQQRIAEMQSRLDSPTAALEVAGRELELQLQKEIEGLRSGIRVAEMKHAEELHQVVIQAQRAKHQAELEIREAQNQSVLEKNAASFAQREAEAAKARERANEAEIRNRLDQERSWMKQRHDEMQAQHQAEIQRLQESHAAAMQNARGLSERLQAEMQAQHQSDIRRVRAAHDDAIKFGQEASEKLKQRLRQERGDHDAEMQNMEATLKERTQRYRNQFEEQDKQIAGLEQELRRRDAQFAEVQAEQRQLREVLGRQDETIEQQNAQAAEQRGRDALQNLRMEDMQHQLRLQQQRQRFLLEEQEAKLRAREHFHEDALRAQALDYDAAMRQAELRFRAQNQDQIAELEENARMERMRNNADFRRALEELQTQHEDELRARVGEIRRMAESGSAPFVRVSPSQGQPRYDSSRVVPPSAPHVSASLPQMRDAGVGHNAVPVPAAPLPELISVAARATITGNHIAVRKATRQGSRKFYNSNFESTNSETIIEAIAGSTRTNPTLYNNQIRNIEFDGVDFTNIDPRDFATIQFANCTFNNCLLPQPLYRHQIVVATNRGLIPLSHPDFASSGNPPQRNPVFEGAIAETFGGGNMIQGRDGRARTDDLLIPEPEVVRPIGRQMQSAMTRQLNAIHAHPEGRGSHPV